MLLDELMPRYDLSERHRVIVGAASGAAYEAARNVDLGRSTTVRLLFAFRGLLRWFGGRGPSTPMTLDGFLRGGFVLLAEDPGREIVLGVVGRFWRPRGEVVRLDPDGFLGFDRPGYAKAAWSIAVRSDTRTGHTILVTETRVVATDAAARRRLRAYWALIRPFSGWVRRRMLALAKADAEGRGRS
jgi:hypothetical protein